MKNVLLITILFAAPCLAFSQQKATKPATAPVPKLTMRWGNRTSGDLTAAQVQQLVDSPLVAVDEKGIRYTVNGFRINYSFKGSYKDEETGQTKQVKDFRAYDFDKTDRLTDPWIESIRDNARKDDEIIFNKILVGLKNGKFVFAPDLKFTVR
jgi:hypothetical protein